MDHRLMPLVTPAAAATQATAPVSPAVRSAVIDSVRRVITASYVDADTGRRIAAALESVSRSGRVVDGTALTTNDPETCWCA